MKLSLKRWCGPEYTIGKLYIDGQYFCDTLEDKTRDINRNGRFDGQEKKIQNQTSIPFGKYDVVLYKSPRFRRILPKLLSVPHFEGILIHRGNTPIDTNGCILVGENKTKGTVSNSTYYENKLVKLMKEAVKKGEQITIEIE